MEDDSRQIPNRLRMYRERHGYKQQEVAYLLGHNTAKLISRWENGEGMPSLENLFKLSVIYSVFPTDLYYDTFQENKSFITNKKQQLSMQSSQ